MTAGPHHVPGTTPYPWPWCGLDAARLALLVVTAPTAPGAFPAGLTDRIRAAGAGLASYSVPTVEVRCVAPPAARATPGGGASSVGDWPDLTVHPVGWDGFHGTPLDGWLRANGRDHLVLAGWWTEIGVHSTMRTANDRGYECLLATDLTAGLDTTTVAATISSTEMSGGIFGAVGLASALLTQLAEEERP